MRSDFWSLPWAAQQAIRRGERSARVANHRAHTVAELQATIERLSAERMQLREALSFYAQHWPSNSGELLDDQGRRARHAIGTLIENVDEHIAALRNTAENG